METCGEFRLRQILNVDSKVRHSKLSYLKFAESDRLSDLTSSLHGQEGAPSNKRVFIVLALI